jgi:hypothetical protein
VALTGLLRLDVAAPYPPSSPNKCCLSSVRRHGTTEALLITGRDFLEAEQAPIARVRHDADDPPRRATELHELAVLAVVQQQ